VPYDVRELRHEDAEAAWRLGALAFGYHDQAMPEGWRPDSAGRRSWGVFDESGRLVAKAVDREQGQWFGGRTVPASGVAGVAVIPELRARGLGRLVLTRLLAEARARGAAISTLFPSTPFPYRRLGWEEVGALTYLALPTAALTTARAADGVTLRPAAADDVPAVHDLYRRVAVESTGMIERTGPLFPDTLDELLADFDGLTVAAGPSGDVEGYATWDRGSGSNAAGKVTVHDLVAVTPGATGTLLAMFAGWASVAPTTVLKLSYHDPALFVLASSLTRVESRQPWMLRAVDAAAAVAARGWPRHLDGQLDLDLEDAACPWNAGPHRLVLSGGEGGLEPGGTGEVRLSSRGFAAWYAGAASPAILRRAGFLGGGDARSDEFLRAATAGPATALHDYF
jgi:predicted acetyltransferase